MKNLIFILIFIPMTSANAQVDNSKPHESLSSPLQVVKEFLTAYMEHNGEKFTSLLHPDVIWVQPGDNRVSGVKKSKAELLQMGAKFAELSAHTLKLVDVKYFSPEGNTVVCILHWTAAQPTGNILDVRNIDVYTVENGRIILVKVFSEDILQEDRFWGKE
jgi:uncharacterized protein